MPLLWIWGHSKIEALALTAPNIPPRHIISGGSDGTPSGSIRHRSGAASLPSASRFMVSSHGQVQARSRHSQVGNLRAHRTQRVLQGKCSKVDVTPSFPPAGIRAGRLLHCYPTLDHSGLEFSAFLGSGGLVAPAEFASKIGGIFPIALCGRSSL